MRNVTFVDSHAEIDQIAPLGPWKEVQTFKSKNRGFTRTRCFSTSEYEVVAKREQSFSAIWIICRVSLGILFAGVTLGGALLFKCERKLFTKRTKTIRFAFPLASSSAADDRGLGSHFLAFKKTISNVFVRPQHQIKRAHESQENAAKSMNQEFDKILGDADNYLSSDQEKLESPIAPLLQKWINADQGIQQVENFVEFLLANDPSGTPRICNLHEAHKKAVINTIKSQSIKLNILHERIEGETLFTRLFDRKDTVNRAAVIDFILDLDSTVIQQLEGGPGSLFVQMALEGAKTEAICLLKAMRGEKVELSSLETWIAKVVDGHPLDRTEFGLLGINDKQKVVFAAHRWDRRATLKSLGKLDIQLARKPRPGHKIFSKNMDIITAEAQIQQFFRRLEAEGALCQEEVWKGEDSSKYDVREIDIGSIQGKQFLGVLSNEYSCSTIKFAKEVLVLSQGVTSIILSASKNFELTPKEDVFKGQYIEKIAVANRQISLQEAYQLLGLLAAARYPFFREEISIAEDGIYFLHTQYQAFRPKVFAQSFESLKGIQDLLKEEDKAQFLSGYDSLIGVSSSSQYKYLEEKQKNRSLFGKDHFTNLVKAYNSHEFVVQLPLSKIK